MSRYIDVDEVCSLIRKEWVRYMPSELDVNLSFVLVKVREAPTIDIVRCKECRWYDPPHILHKDGTRTDVDEGSPWVTVDVGINCGGQCIHHIDLKTYCVNHDRENPDDNERIVIFRSPDDFCSYGERKDEPYEYEIKALHKDYVEPYVKIEDEPQTEDLQDWKDRMWTEAIEDEPQTDCSWK